MFKGFTKDLAGTADICNIVSGDFSKLLASAYVLSDLSGSSQEEVILFAFASPKEEFAFTNHALITVRGESATTTRKVVERIEFRDAQVSNVQFETTGRVDRDCELKFHIGGEDNEISIDIAKKEEDAAKAYYKALVALAREQEERIRRWSFAQNGLKSASESVRLRGVAISATEQVQGETTGAAAGLVGQANQVLDWLTSDFERLNPRCFKDVIVKALASQANQ